jgi:hypothetical protein
MRRSICSSVDCEPGRSRFPDGGAPSKLTIQNKGGESLTVLYTWLVFIHVLAAFGFVLAHGTSAFVAFRVRAERDRCRVVALLDLSTASMGFMYGSLLVLVLAGIAAGVVGHWFAQWWTWASILLLVAITAAMGGYAAPYYRRLREALGLPSPRARGVTTTPATPEELEALLRAGRPGWMAAIGGVGLAVLLWLMVFKPF